MDHLLSHGRRAELTREIESGRIERDLRAGRARLGAFWLPGEIVAAGTRSSPKIRRLRDTGTLART